jgi:predicted transcriptional regulator
LLIMGRSSCITITVVLAALSDKKSLILLSQIGLAEVDSQFLLAETRLTAKAFYSRMSRLLKIGIITRKSGKYSLTSFGKIVYDAQDLITRALNNYWRLSALDSVGMIDSLPITEYNKISNTLLGDCQIKNVLVRQLGELTTTKSESLICLNNLIPIKTQGTGNTARGYQAT